ncbi:MAG TPA: hypothetical protein DCE41_12835 [Cytophagales bacterium]|nr:hypothetical protein [Cytophagales bacterium]HAA21528.1 hypothetical protein [Cytophagales bacterium]HAP64056.1 hypothetical protein [Cytophagales bacterium]
MKVLPFKIPMTGDPAILTQIDSGSHYYDILHKHPEYQITRVEKGHGTLICDEYLGRFEPGSLFMVGSNQPHVLQCDEEYYLGDESKTVYAESIFFRQDSLGREFLRLEETQGLSKFLDLGKQGLKFSARTSAQVAPLLQEMMPLKGFDLIVHYIRILKYLMEDTQTELLSHFQRSMTENEGQRMNAVMQYTIKNFRESITIDAIASVANMTPNAFCKYFKTRTRKTYLNYLNEIRIAYACRQLQDYNLSVSQVAHQSGFQNLSHFNRCFKRVMGVTPGKYGREMNRV